PDTQPKTFGRPSRFWPANRAMTRLGRGRTPRVGQDAPLTGRALLLGSFNESRSLAGVDPGFDLVTEVTDQPLNGPGRSVAERADGVAFHLLGHLKQQIDFALLRLAPNEPFHDAPHPACAFPTRRALSAAFVLVEVGDAGDGLDDVGGLIHDDDAGGAKPRLDLRQSVKIHRQVIT